MSGPGPAETMRRLLEAVNAHDLETMVALFADDYRNETPAHPQRGFRGSAQVRRNWTELFARVPDLHARLPRVAVDGSGRSAQTFLVEVVARRGDEERRIAVRGQDIYAVTAPLVVEAALRVRAAPAPGVHTAGALFDPDDFLAALAHVLHRVTG